MHQKEKENDLEYLKRIFKKIRAARCPDYSYSRLFADAAAESHAVSHGTASADHQKFLAALALPRKDQGSYRIPDSYLRRFLDDRVETGSLMRPRISVRDHRPNRFVRHFSPLYARA